MPDASAVATMAAGVITATPAVPAIRAAPAGALVRLITAPIPAGTIPAVVIPTIVFVIEGKVLDFFDRRRALPRAKRLSRPVADAGLGAARQERKEERERQDDARKQADHCSPFSEEDLAQAAGLAPEAQSVTRRIETATVQPPLPFRRPNAADRR
jgi:hypothetical protein